MSLRTLGGLSFLSLLLTWVGQPQAAPDPEEAAVKAIEKLGGDVMHDKNDPTKPVVGVYLILTPAKDKDLKVLAGLKELKTLTIKNSGITGAGLKELAGLKRFHTLNLANSGVTDAGLKGVACLQGLKELDLSETNVSDAGLKELAGLKSLEVLGLVETGVTDAGLKELVHFKKLTLVNLLVCTKVTKAGIAELHKALPDCEIIYGYNAP
jgi:internalin A